MPVLQTLWHEAQKPVNEVWRWAARLKEAQESHDALTAQLRADSQALLLERSQLQLEFQKVTIENAYLKRKLGVSGTGRVMHNPAMAHRNSHS